MKKQGFTLIELLAVIVILAIIALIATPIILGVIGDAKKKARENSIHGYVESIKLEVTKYALYNNGDNPSFTEEYIKDIPYQGDKVTCGLDGKTPGIYYSNQYGVVLHGCTVGNDDTLYYYGNGIYQDKTDPKYQEIINSVAGGGSGDITLTGTPIADYAKNLVYSGNTCKTDGTTYQYMGGCYIKGAPTTNYVWYSGFLWRIMGINSDGTIKLITEESVAAIIYNIEKNINFNGSYIDKWLNDYFFSHLKGTNIISDGAFCQSVPPIDFPLRADCTGGTTLNRKVGLISADEYNLSGGVSSYLTNSQEFWTMTPDTSNQILDINYDGDLLVHETIYANSTRPIINIKSDAIITSGNGTLNSTWSDGNSPYILNEDKSGTVAGTLETKAVSGEYVQFGSKIYRVVSQSNGATKLLLDGYYLPTGGYYSMSFGSNSVFTTTSGVGQRLNNEVLNYLAPTDELKNRILPSTWYQNRLFYGDSYEVSLNETNPTLKIENVKVGLIRVGELLSGQSYTILTKNGTVKSNNLNANNYWLLTPYTASESVWEVSSEGYVTSTAVSFSRSLRPTINVSSTSNIVSGNGTPSSPYQI